MNYSSNPNYNHHMRQLAGLEAPRSAERKDLIDRLFGAWEEAGVSLATLRESVSREVAGCEAGLTPSIEEAKGQVEAEVGKLLAVVQDAEAFLSQPDLTPGA